MKLSEIAIKKECAKFAKDFCKEYNLVKSEVVDKSLVYSELIANEMIEPTFGVKVYGTKENIMNMLNDCFDVDENDIEVDVKEESNGLVSVILPYHYEEIYSVIPNGPHNLSLTNTKN